MVKLYTYWRSSTSFRVRTALNIKRIEYESVPVDLLAGQQREPEYARLNPGLGVPAVVLDDGTVLTQSMAIMEWLEETVPEPRILPDTPADRARVRAASMIIASEVHPLNNSRVVDRLKELGHTQDEVVAWMTDWMTRGFASFQALIDPHTSYCFGALPGLADICLIPQLYNAHRWGCDLTSFTRLTDIEQRCLAQPAFQAARPENQPDAV